MTDTASQFDAALAPCRDIFARKLADYGPSWRVMRPASITDQLFIKAKRLRTLQTLADGTAEQGGLVGEDPRGEWMALVNYGIIALLQLTLPDTVTPDITAEQALALYDRHAAATRELMLAKTHDYGDAWRDMRLCSFTDIILTKLQRIKEIEANGGRTSVSEGVASNYQDIVNYAIFALIHLAE